MHKDLIVAVLALIALCVFGRWYFEENANTVYGCSEKDLPPSVIMDCKKKGFKQPKQEQHMKLFGSKYHA